MKQFEDWSAELRKVKKGEELSPIIEWGFYDDDLTELAKLHKANKFRKKIENLLTDCNFHSECRDFSNHNYESYIK